MEGWVDSDSDKKTHIFSFPQTVLLVDPSVKENFQKTHDRPEGVYPGLYLNFVSTGKFFIKKEVDDTHTNRHSVFTLVETLYGVILVLIRERPVEDLY